MPKQTSLFLTILLICLTLNFCTKNDQNRIYIDLSGLYSDTVTMSYPQQCLIIDSVITKEIIKINDSTYKMSRFICNVSVGCFCDSIRLLVHGDNTISIYYLDPVLVGPPYITNGGYLISDSGYIYLETRWTTTMFGKERMKKQ